MADISKEQAAWKNARYGEEVRDAEIALNEKINKEVEAGTKRIEEYGKEETARANAEKNRATAEEKRIQEFSLLKKELQASTNAAKEITENVQGKLERGDFVGPTGPTGPQGAKGNTGPQGPKGDKGDTGAQGAKGTTGEKGLNGKSAYEIWLSQTGNAGKTEAEFLAAIKGEKGDKGETGAKGATGPTGPTGPQGAKGNTGPQGPKGEIDADTPITYSESTADKPPATGSTLKALIGWCVGKIKANLAKITNLEDKYTTLNSTLTDIKTADISVHQNLKVISDHYKVYKNSKIVSWKLQATITENIATESIIAAIPIGFYPAFNVPIKPLIIENGIAKIVTFSIQRDGRIITYGSLPKGVEINVNGSYICQ